MTALLPPNLLRLFAPRAQPPFLKPLTKSESVRGPNKLTGCAELVKRIREEAEEAEYAEGLKDRPETKSEKTGINGDADPESKRRKGEPQKEDGMEVDEPEKQDEEIDGERRKKKGKGKGKQQPKRKKDAIAEAGIIGQEAVKMRREARAKRKEQYEKDLEKNCELPRYERCAKLICLPDRPQDDPNATGDPYKTLFISRLVSFLHLNEFTADVCCSLGKPQRTTCKRSLKSMAPSRRSTSFEIARARARTMPSLCMNGNGI